MTNEPSQPDASGTAAVDPELEQLLGDACEAPPVPRSLLQRIDAGIEREWGVSPRLAQRPSQRMARAISGGAGSVRRRARWLRALPIAASLGLLFVVGVILNPGAGGFAWADVLEAIAQRGTIEIDSPASVRRLSLSEEIVTEQTAQAARLVDLREHVMLSRDGTEPVRRYRIASGAAALNRDQLLVGFLLGGTAMAGDPQRLKGLRLIDEDWRKVSSAGESQIALRVRFETDTEPIELHLRLDPDSHLPRECEVLAGDRSAGPVTLSYPDADLASLRQQTFPSGEATVESDVTLEGPLAAIAALETPAVTPGIASLEGMIPGESAISEPVTGEPDFAAATTNEAAPVRSAAVPAIGSASTSPAEATATLLAATTKWAPVPVPELHDAQVLQQVDATLEQLWSENNIEPAPLADDEELLRRVYLDLAGRTPSVNEVRAYLNDTSDDRYEQLVDQLLESPDHASHLATVWRTFLIPEGVDLAAFGGVAAFDEWLADRFARNEAYDKIVRRLLLAEGRLSRSGPLLFYSAVKLDPDQLAARTSRVFLGMRLECAQCHDHPFEAWTQEDFWSLAAFFARISRPQTELEGVSTVMRVRDIDRGEVKLPWSDTVIPPRFLDGTSLAEGEQDSARRQQLAEWLTGGDNPWFARAAANRVWGQMFGKGIIDPVDDFGEANPPVSPELLDLLAGQFLRTGFDLRALFRTIALSKAYRLSSGAATEDERRLELFAQMNVKTLTAEQVYDCIRVATMLEAPAANPTEFNVLRIGNTDRDLFLQQFRTPAGRRTEYQGGIPQALTLMNGRLIEGATGLASSGLLRSLEAPFFTNEQRIEVLYLATLSRRPRESEWDLLETWIPDGATGDELREGLSDLLWALLNSAEFTMNH